jgi:hypothetical protein
MDLALTLLSRLSAGCDRFGERQCGKPLHGDIYGSPRATPAHAVRSRNQGGMVVVTGPGQIFTRLAQAWP